MSHIDDATKDLTVCISKLQDDMSISHVGEHVALNSICLQMIIIQLAGIRDALEALAPKREEPCDPV